LALRLHRNHLTAAADESATTAPPTAAEPRRRGRARRVFSGTRELVRIVWRDPEHVAERLTLYAVDRLGASSAEWALRTRRERADTPPSHVAEELRTQTAQIARIDGAISGTPFFIALVPGYLTYLWQEMVMTLRIAAMYGRNPMQLQTAAEMLALRGVQPDVKSAETALIRARDNPMPARPAERHSLRTWYRSVTQLLIFGGFMSPSTGEKRTRARGVLAFALGGAIWLTTWVVPFTFMIAMAWACETHARQLGRRALVFYDGEEATAAAAIALADRRRDRGHDRRAVLRAGALFLSVAIPIAFVAVMQHERNTVGINWVAALGALVALSLVIATAVVSSRR